MPQVLTTGGWRAMRWEQWPGLENWGMEVVETSGLSPQRVAAEVVAWCDRALRGEAPVMQAVERPGRADA
jgi:hypothetical protein